MQDYLDMNFQSGSRNMGDIKVVPTKDLVWGTQSYLIRISADTAGLGFPEVTYFEKASSPESSESDSGSHEC